LRIAKAVLALRARNMSPEEIARELKLQISEVDGILKSNGVIA
jgi:DNA-binding CsgD family transcriptional regulator